MKYSLCGLGGWMGELRAGSGMGREKWGLGELPSIVYESCPSSDPCGTGEMGNEELWPRLGKDQMRFDRCWTLHPLYLFRPVYTGTEISPNPIIHLCQPHFSPSTNQHLKKN